MDIIANLLFKGVIGGLGKVFADSTSKILSLFLTDKMVAQILIGLAEALVKRTKNTIDDNAVATWKEQIIEAGISLK